MPFGVGSSTQPQGNMNMDQMEAATQELDMITDVFNRMVASCHSKCINQRYSEGDLNKGESVCIDRCVAKYIEVNKVIGEKMRAAGQQQGGF